MKPATKKVSRSRKQRLAQARTWLASYKNKHHARDYRRRFGVDAVCAVKELVMLGVKLDSAYIADVLKNHQLRKFAAIAKKEQAEKDKFVSIHGVYGVDYDDDFAFIAGRTAGGAPFGLSWEERENQN